MAQRAEVVLDEEEREVLELSREPANGLLLGGLLKEPPRERVPHELCAAGKP
jgi:hypothetical protein